MPCANLSACRKFGSESEECNAALDKFSLAHAGKGISTKYTTKKSGKGNYASLCTGALVEGDIAAVVLGVLLVAAVAAIAVLLLVPRCRRVSAGSAAAHK